jgi:hypothetical protein
MTFFFLGAGHRKAPGQKRQNEKAGRYCAPGFFEDSIANHIGGTVSVKGQT